MHKARLFPALPAFYFPPRAERPLYHHSAAILSLSDLSAAIPCQVYPLPSLSPANSIRCQRLSADK